MKKSLKGLSLSLCAVLLLAGCSCNKDNKDNSVNANIKDGSSSLVSGLTEGTESITLQAIYDDLKAETGNEVAAKKLLDIIASGVLSDPTWQDRYEEKVQEKLMELTKNDSYKVNGEFSEELLVASLKSKLYNITCGTTAPIYGPTYKTEDRDGVSVSVVDKNLLCNYDDYVEKALRLDVLNELLKEKYVYDKVLADKPNLLTTKKIRLVEYVSIDSSLDYSFDFITEAAKKLSEENSTTTLESIKTEWENKLLSELMTKYNKISTKDDANGTIFQEFTNSYSYSKEEGLKLKKEEILNGKYYDKVVISSDSKDILNTTLVERILSENVLNEAAEKTFEINGSYYLVSPLAGTNIDASDIRITDTTNKKYYLVKVDVITIDTDSTENIEEDETIYDAVKVLASNSTLVSDYVNYYLDQNKNDISVHDDEVYAYLKTQYKNIFVD